MQSERRGRRGRAGWGCAVVNSRARQLGKHELLKGNVYQAAVRKHSVYACD